MKKIINLIKAIVTGAQLILLSSIAIILMLLFFSIQKTKRIFIMTLIAIVIISFSAIIYTLLFGSNIENLVRDKINNNLKTPLSETTNIEFSLFKNFPNASITLSDLIILDSYNNSSDTLIYAEEGIIKFNIFDILSKEYSFENTLIKNGIVNIKYDNDNVSNFEIFKDSENKNRLDIKKIKILNLQTSFINEKIDLFYKSHINNLEINISSVDSQLSLILDGQSKSTFLSIKNESFIKNKEINLNSKIIFSKDSLNITSNNISINDVNFTNLEYINNKDKYIIKFSSKNQKIESIISIIPDKFQYLTHGYKLTGLINANVNIKKEKNHIDPSCNIDFILSEAKYININNPFELSEINCEGKFNNGKSHSLETCEFEFKNLTSKKGDGVFNGDFKIKNFNNYSLNSNLYSSWKLYELDNLFLEESPFKNLKGTVKANINYNGKLSFDDKMKEHIGLSNYTANLDFNNVSFNYKNSALDFKFNSSQWEIKDNVVKIQDDKFLVSESDLNFSGEIDNLILYLLDQKNKITINNAKIYSDYIKFDELLKIMDINDTEELYDSKFSGVFPNWINLNTSKFNVKKINYRNFNGTNFTGEIQYLGNPNSNLLGRLYCKNMTMNVIDGNIESDKLEYSENKLNDLILKSQMKFDNINISDLFNSFNNFGQSFMTDENIQGIASSDINLEVMWNGETDTLYPESLYMDADLKIINGELINFQPMYELSNYISIQELENIKFDTLKNEITIKNKKVKIPKMDIHSNAFSIFDFKGTHHFDNKMNYKFGLSLSDVLTKKINKNIKEEGVKKNTKGQTIIQLKMKGYPENLKVSLNKIKIQDDLAKGIKEEVEEITNVILDNSENKEEREKEKIDNGSKIEIEWEDEK